MKLRLLPLLLITIALTACSKPEQTPQPQQPQEQASLIDENTVKKSDLPSYVITEERIETLESQQPAESEEAIDLIDYIGQLVIENTDESQNFEISENHIIYNGITFHDLYSNISSLQSPYSINTFINFILQTYNTTEDVYTSYIDYTAIANQEVPEGADNTTITPDELLSGNPKYDSLKAKYGEPVTWELFICNYGGKNAGTFYGCKSYVIFIGTDSDIVITLGEN